MKMQHLLALFTAIVVFASCEPQLVFEEPQPSSSKEQTSFKRKYQGNYLNLEDSSQLLISEHTILRKWTGEGHIEMDNLDSINAQINADNLTLISTNADSALVQFNYQKNVFNLSSDQVLKRYKNYCFLNDQDAAGNWKLTLLYFSDQDELVLKELKNDEAAIDLMERLTHLKAIVNEEGETEDYLANPTKEEWKEIIDADVFTNAQYFIKTE